MLFCCILIVCQIVIIGRPILVHMNVIALLRAACDSFQSFNRNVLHATYAHIRKYHFIEMLLVGYF